MQSLTLQRNARWSAAGCAFLGAGKSLYVWIQGSVEEGWTMNLKDRVAMLEQEVRTLRSSLAERGVIEGPFRVVGASGLPLLSLRETERGGELTLYDAAGGRIAVVGQALNGGNGVAIFSSAGKRVAGLFADREGGHLAVYDNEGYGVAGVVACPSGGCLSVRDRDGKNYAGLIAHADGAEMGFFENGVPVRSIPE